MKKILNAFTKAIGHNEKNDKKKSFQITYKKLNGRTVKRKIDPSSLRNNVVVAYDHKRKAVRSFKLERINSMQKVAFFEGFFKEAKKEEKPLISAKSKLIGAAMLAGGTYLGAKKVLPKLGTTIGRIKAKGLESKLPSNVVSIDRKKSVSDIVKSTVVPDKKKAADVIDLHTRRKIASFVEFMKVSTLGEHLTHAAELGGLGILAAPSIKKMVTGKEMSEDNKHRTELAGLGVLAAPSAMHLAKSIGSKIKV